jgi:hypothetical protein
MKSKIHFLMLLFFPFGAFSQTDSCTIYIPNNVSMHCDQAGMDFLLEVQHNCPFSEAHFMVFDRWGEVLHDSTDLHPEFDASKLPQATYVYRLDVVYSNGNKQRVQGDFVVLK